MLLYATQVTLVARLLWASTIQPLFANEGILEVVLPALRLAEQLTTLATAVSQLDGASRSLEQLGYLGKAGDLVTF